MHETYENLTFQSSFFCLEYKKHGHEQVDYEMNVLVFKGVAI